MAMLAVGLTLAALPSWAHHGRAEFDASKVVRMEGVVTTVEWMNPHVLIHLAVKDDRGAVTRWRIDCAPPATLRRSGLAQESLAAGSELTVTGYAASNGDRILGATLLQLKGGDEIRTSLVDFTRTDTVGFTNPK